MASFEELRAKAKELAQAGAAKAKEVTGVAKLNLENSAEEDAIRKAYIEIGKLYYAERGMAPEGAYVALCEKVTASKQVIAANKEKLKEMKANGVVMEDVDLDSDVDIEVSFEEVKEIQED